MIRSLSRFAFVSLATCLLLAGSASAQIVFQPPVSSMPVQFARSAVIGDVNEDGHLDAITSSLSSGPQPALTLGLGDGSFGPPQALTAFPGGAGIFRLADFDHDGHLDALVSTGLTGIGSIAIAPGDGRGGFGIMTALNVADEQAGTADAGDFDADGNLDVALFNRPTVFAPASVLAIFGHGDGSFEAPIELASVTHASLVNDGFAGVRVGDTNGDGFDDLVLSASAANGVLLSLGDGRFEPVACGGGCVHALGGDLADLNADGRMDVVEPTRLLVAQPDGSLQLSQTLPQLGFQYASDAADFDADGKLDVALARSMGPNGVGGSMLFLRGLGNGTVQTTGTATGLVPGDLSDVEAADLDGDGRPDVVVVGSANGLNLARLSSLLNYTYVPGSPFLDLGGATVNGLFGSPIQLATGTLVPGQPFSFRLYNAPFNAQCFHVVGFAPLNAPFKGGTMVPVPSMMNGPFLITTNPFTIAGNWPAGGSGVALYLQFWCKGPSGSPPANFSASSGVRAQIP